MTGFHFIPPPKATELLAGALFDQLRAGPKPRPVYFGFFCYAALVWKLCAARSIFSARMPYPRVESFTRTWVTAPTRRPS